MSKNDDRPLLRLGHSPDPDDAFMWWPLFEVEGKPPHVDTGRFRFVPVTADIESLNIRSESDGNALELTAISCAQYPNVQDRYAITSCGASMGERYGPKLVAKRKLSIEDLGRSNVTIAIPGARTSAFATLTMLLGKGRFRHEVVPFEQIIDRVANCTFDAGLVIHEGQLTYADAGLHLVQDLGAWWWKQHGLPLPLGVNVIRRDLEQLHGEGSLVEITTLLLRSVEYALLHREQSIRYALGYARGMAASLANEFIGMYVNKRTLDFGETGRKAVEVFLHEAKQAGAVAQAAKPDFINALGEYSQPTL